MLGGISPIIIFQFSKLQPTLGETISKIPLVSKIPTLIDEPPIPIYLDEALTGILIDSEDKSIDIDTTFNTTTKGDSPTVDQKGVGSFISINITIKKTSIGVALLSAMMDRVFEKVTSKEYKVTYLNGAVTIFRGVIRSMVLNQNADNELATLRIEISKGEKQPQAPPSIGSVGFQEVPL